MYSKLENPFGHLCARGKGATRSVWNVLSSGLVVKTVWTCAPFIESVSRNIIG